jgi:hypothetical protein
MGGSRHLLRRTGQGSILGTIPILGAHTEIDAERPLEENLGFNFMDGDSIQAVS